MSSTFKPPAASRSRGVAELIFYTYADHSHMDHTCTDHIYRHDDGDEDAENDGDDDESW